MALGDGRNPFAELNPDLLFGGNPDPVRSAVEQMMMAQQAAQAQAAQVNAWPAPAFPTLPLPQASPQTQPSQSAVISTRARSMFVKRVGGLERELHLHPTLDFVHCHPYNDEIIMFYILRGKEGIIHEPIDLFPSDTLVAQFRLIIASGE